MQLQQIPIFRNNYASRTVKCRVSSSAEHIFSLGPESVPTGKSHSLGYFI